jgi:hypothetical protein
MTTTDPADMLSMLEAIGGLTQMTDAEIHAAWDDYANRTPVSTFGNSLGVLYLWARMSRMGEEVEVPAGWGAEQYVQAIETEKSRRELPALTQRMEGGEGLSEAERRAVMTRLAKEDPAKAVDLWCRTTRPEDYVNDSKWLSGALTAPGSRETIMARLREWQKGKDLPGVVSFLAKDWISKDPAGAERWLMEPSQADVRSAMMREVSVSRALADPVSAWKWSEGVEGEARMEALRMAAGQLAIRDADQGIKFIAELAEPAERDIALKNFASTLAAQEYEKWETWRDGLPEVEQAVVNESAFPLWVNKDVAAATDWLNTRPAGEARDAMISTLVTHYAGKENATCVQWIRTISDVSRRRDAVGAALSNVGPHDLEQIQAILAAVGE